MRARGARSSSRILPCSQNMYARCWMFAQRTSDGPIPIGSSYLCCPRYTRIETFGTKDRYHDVHHIRRRRSDSNFAAVYSNDAYAKLLLAFLLCPFDRLLLHVFAFVRSQITARYICLCHRYTSEHDPSSNIHRPVKPTSGNPSLHRPAYKICCYESS